MVVPRHPPNREYIAAVEEVCLCLPLKVAAELRADTSKTSGQDTHPRPNITIQEARGIKELKSDQSRIILTVDKWEVMDRQDYSTKAQGLLDDKDPTAKLESQLINILQNCKAKGQINQDTYKNLYPTCAIPS